MTREQQLAKLAELKATADTKVKEYNDLMLDAKFEDAMKLDKVIDQAINEYTGIAKNIAFEECKAAEDPMVSACLRLTYTTIKARDVAPEGSKLKLRTLEEYERQIDLEKLHKYCGGIGHNKDWIYAVEKLNMLMTAQKAVDLGINPKEINDSYAMKEIAKSYDLGKNPASKTNLLKTLTAIVQMMLGEGYKPTSHDVNYLLSIYSKKSRKALTVTCANHKFMRNYVQEICHKIITGKTYEIEYKKAK